MDKRKQHFSKDEDFEVEKKPRMREGAAAASTQKKKTDPDPSKPKMREGTAAASTQKKKDPNKKQLRQVMTMSISADVSALKDDDDVVTTKHPHCFSDETDTDVAAWERGIAQLVSSLFIFIRTVIPERPANAQQTLSKRSADACEFGLHGLKLFFQAADMVFDDILVPAHYLR